MTAVTIISILGLLLVAALMVVWAEKHLLEKDKPMHTFDDSGVERQLSPELVMLARISPPEYAPLILARNEALLVLLEELRPYVGKTVGDTPDEVLKKVLTGVQMGCPHCILPYGMGCSQGDQKWMHHTAGTPVCLWHDAFPGKIGDDGNYHPECYPCLDAIFGNVCANDVECESISVMYGTKITWISIHGISDPKYLESLEPEAMLDEVDFKNCLTLVLGHIAWAKLPEWGADYNPPKED